MDASAEPQIMRLNITTPKLSTGEIQALLDVLAAKREAFPVFVPWVASMLIAEANRRQRDDAEPEMFVMPNFSRPELADCLLGSFVATRWPVTENLGRFLDDVAEHVVGAAAGTLQTIEAQQ